MRIGGTTITVVEGDLTRQAVDAIVNAANVHLRHGGGVAAAIAAAGGPTIQGESDAWVAEHGPLDDGVAAVTSGGNLAARWVVHVAGPVYDADRDDNADRLAVAVRAALEAALEAGATSVALPAISAGIYGYPRDEATAVIAAAVAAVARTDDRLDDVRLVALDETTAVAFRAGLDRLG